MALRNAHEAKDGVHAECEVRLRGVDIHWARLNLAATNARRDLVKKLSEIDPALPWREHLELACRRTAESVRAVPPLIALSPAPRPPGQRDLIENVIPLGHTSLFYGDGDSGKGFVALLIALGVITGKSLPHLRPTRQGLRVVYFDWEVNAEDIQARLHALCRGLNLTLPPGLFLYREMFRALADDAPRLRAELHPRRRRCHHRR